MLPTRWTIFGLLEPPPGIIVRIPVLTPEVLGVKLTSIRHHPFRGGAEFPPAYRRMDISGLGLW